MDAKETARWNGQLKIKKVREDNATVPVSPVVKRVFARHDGIVAHIEDLTTTPAGRSKGATLKKSAEELRAIAAALPIANGMHLLYLEDETDEKGSEKAHALRLFKSDYQNLPGTTTLAETRNVAKQALAMKAKLMSEAEIDKAELDELDEANRMLGILMAAPKLARESGKVNNTAVSTALKEAGIFVKTTLTQAVETFKTKQPKFYALMKEAMRIDDAASASATPAAAAPAAPGSTPA